VHCALDVQCAIVFVIVVVDDDVDVGLGLPGIYYIQPACVRQPDTLLAPHVLRQPRHHPRGRSLFGPFIPFLHSFGCISVSDSYLLLLVTI
jgi:hypothetical protein